MFSLNSLTTLHCRYCIICECALVPGKEDAMQYTLTYFPKMRARVCKIYAHVHKRKS